MGFLAANSRSNSIANNANNLQSTAGAFAMINNNRANDSADWYNQMLGLQLSKQQAQIQGLLGPALTPEDMKPGMSPGIATSQLGDQSKANVGRSSLIGF